MYLLAVQLHTHGSNNPLGISSTSDKIRFHPYYTSKDLIGFFAFGIVFSYFVFFNPNYLGQLAQNSCEVILYKGPICLNELAPLIKGSIFLATSKVGFLGGINKDPYLRNFLHPSVTMPINLQLAGNFQSPETIRTKSCKTFNPAAPAVPPTEFLPFYLAGLIEADGCIYTPTNLKQSVSIEITLATKDKQALYKLKSLLGYGTIDKRSKVEAYRLRIRTKAGVSHVLNLINGKLVSPSKIASFIKAADRIGLSNINTTPLTNIITNAWLTGFLDGDGYFSIRDKYTLTISIGQKDSGSLDLIEACLGVGHIYYDSSWNGYNWAVTDLAGIKQVLTYLEMYPPLTTHTIDIVTFKRLILFIEQGDHLAKSKEKCKIDNLVAKFRARFKGGALSPFISSPKPMVPHATALTPGASRNGLDPWRSSASIEILDKDIVQGVIQHPDNYIPANSLVTPAHISPEWYF